MTTILPAERTPFDVLGRDVGQALQQVLPGAVQQGYNRQLGMNALNQAQQEIAQANGDPTKIAMAFSRMAIASPEAARALGPIATSAMAQAKTNRAFPSQPGSPQTPITGVQATAQPQPQGEPSPVTGNTPSSGFATPSPFNIMTAPEIDAESQRYAQAVQDPNAYQTRQTQLQNQNTIAQAQRQDLEQTALNSGVKPDQLPIFMKVGQKFDPRNPSEWTLNTQREFNKVKSNMDKTYRAFIPGLGSALLGRDRPEALKRLQGTTQDLVKEGFENEVRNILTDNYLSPSEVEEQINPISKQKEAAIKKLPSGIFQRETPRKPSIIEPPTPIERGTISYEEALEKAPKEIQKMQNILSDFFKKNVDDDTSLLVLRDKLWDDKGYDWRQIGPAIRQAQEQGLKLNTRQLTELPTLETNPPIQSLPDIFMDWDRVVQFIRGNK